MKKLVDIAKGRSIGAEPLALAVKLSPQDLALFVGARTAAVCLEGVRCSSEAKFVSAFIGSSPASARTPRSDSRWAGDVTVSEGGGLTIELLPRVRWDLTSSIIVTLVPRASPVLRSMLIASAAIAKKPWPRGRGEEEAR